MCGISLRDMRWPIDDRTDQDLAGYYTARRERGWGFDRLTHETAPGIGFVG